MPGGNTGTDFCRIPGNEGFTALSCSSFFFFFSARFSNILNAHSPHSSRMHSGDQIPGLHTQLALQRHHHSVPLWGNKMWPLEK